MDTVNNTVAAIAERSTMTAHFLAAREPHAPVVLASSDGEHIISSSSVFAGFSRNCSLFNATHGF